MYPPGIRRTTVFWNLNNENALGKSWIAKEWSNWWHSVEKVTGVGEDIQKTEGIEYFWKRRKKKDRGTKWRWSSRQELEGFFPKLNINYQRALSRRVRFRLQCREWIREKSFWSQGESKWRCYIWKKCRGYDNRHKD